jgi:hypothetical protein
MHKKVWRNKVGEKSIHVCFLSIMIISSLAACKSLSGEFNVDKENPVSVSISETPTRTPYQPEAQLPIPTVTEMIISNEIGTSLRKDTLWISPSVPNLLRNYALGFGLSQANDEKNSTVRLDASNVTRADSATWIYALVTPFPTIPDGVSFSDILDAWSGVSSGPFAGRPIYMEESTLAAFSSIWGSPGEGTVQVEDPDKMVDVAWTHRPAWAIIPFEQLEPRWKVLEVDNQSPIHNDFNQITYPLQVTFSLQPQDFPLLNTNRDPGKLTVLAMTGVTALVRGTADKMERKGILYPGEDIRTILRAADVTHISNEIPFLEGCPPPDPWTNSLKFCSDPRYIALLEDIGTDVVELTGNHILDYGLEAAGFTLDMYDDQHWLYFGGGHNLQESFQPALLNDHGNKLAFFGCNFFGPASDWATETTPGSTPCDFDQIAMEIASKRSEGYLPIMTFQYYEYYGPNPGGAEQDDFERMAEAGAVVVSGSQSHVPAIMEFHGETYIHYGLGNLFFDQMSYQMSDGSIIDTTRKGFVDRHIFYDGRYISTELMTHIIEDYARPRMMTGIERSGFLQYIFSEAGW